MSSPPTLTSQNDPDNSKDPFAGLEFCGIPFRHPILTAAGTFNYGREYARLFALSELGGVITKGTSETPRSGNPTPRVVETPAGMLNAIGLENKGIDAYLEEELPWLCAQGTVVIVNIFGESPEAFARIARKLGALPQLIELNLSCPNVHGGQLPFSNDPAAAAEIVSQVKQATELPIIAKLSPSTDPRPIAEALERAGVDGFSLVNTLPGMRIDLEKHRPVLGQGSGGLSGPALLPIAVRLIHTLYCNTDKPIIGMGGVTSAEDALELALAGARLIAVGTAIFTNPFAPLEIAASVHTWLERRQTSWLKLIGCAHKIHP